MKRLLVLLLLLFAGGAAFAQPGKKVTMTGTVVDSVDRRPMPHAKVIIYFAANDSTYVPADTVITDAAGHFTAHCMIPYDRKLDYSVLAPDVFYDGYEFAFEEALDAEVAENILHVTIVLRAAKEPAH